MKTKRSIYGNFENAQYVPCKRSTLLKRYKQTEKKSINLPYRMLAIHNRQKKKKIHHVHNKSLLGRKPNETFAFCLIVNYISFKLLPTKVYK